MSEFSDRPFMAGGLTGLRSFRVDGLGRLTGVSHREVWRPGVNEAKCRRGEPIGFGSFLSNNWGFGSAAITISPSVKAALESKPEEEPPHEVASLNCGCGYYAYFDTASNPYHDDDQIEAVISATGLATVGSRGFRAAKAEIVGLVIPTPQRLGWLSNAWRQFARWADDHEGFAIPTSIVLSIMGLLATVGSLAAGPFWILALSTPAQFLGALLLRGTFAGQKYRHASRGALAPDYDLVRRNYPDVPVYPSVAAALDAHPLTFIPKPTPETDEDFWTRSAS